MIRFILVALLVVGFLIFSIPLLLWENHVGKQDPEKQQAHSLKIVQAMFRLILRISGVQVTVRGQERIPEGPVLYVGNHQSYFDILVGYTTVPTLLGFVAKKEMERYILLRDWMRNVNCLFLDRTDIKAGISVWIFPEGTRNINEDVTELLPFKEGSLKIAEKAGCPIVPVAITGTSEVFEKHIPFIRRSQVTIEFGEPFYAQELPLAERKHAGAYTRNKIIEMLKAEQQIRRSGK